MRIIFVAGGTSGHINPAINIANYIRENVNDSKILFVGSKNGLESSLVKKEGFDFEGITVSGFSRKLGFSFLIKNIKSIKNIFVSSFESRRILKKFRPDICIGTGGYVTGAFLFQSSLMKIPFLIQEQNAIPGLTTKILSKRAKFVLLGNKDAEKYIKNKNCIYTGNPISNNFCSYSKDKCRKELGIDTNLPVILSFGGSLGSELINSTILGVIKTNRYFHIHSCGKNNKEFYKISKNMNFKNANIEQYIYGIDKYIISSDIVICRSGAMTLSELAPLGKKVILIPSPNVTNNHQLHNAISYAKKFDATVIEERYLNVKDLILKIEEILSNNNKIQKEENNSCEKIFKIINNITEKKYLQTL